ncbi:MAG: mechanosensitive ion channel [Candidatus Eremiobacteraeota bacterium]|nr:mechanosensitive ion channel [Candidatus Eremiobacteraeota bacterium]
MEYLKNMKHVLFGWLNDPTAVKVMVMVVGLLILNRLMHFVHRQLDLRMRNPESVYPMKKLTMVFAYVVAFIFITGIFRDKLGGLTLAFGVAGAGIAFALQEVIASIAGWVAIMMGNFYRVGDRVLLGGIKGDVIDIGVLRTTLMELGDWVRGDGYNGRIVRVANSFVFKEPVYNYSGDFPFLWDEIIVPVKYGSDWKLAKRLFKEAADEVMKEHTEVARTAWEHMVKNYRIENASVEPKVWMTANDNWIEFTVRYVVDFKERRDARDRIFTRILEEVEGSRGAVGLASATFHLVEAPVFTVKLRDAPSDIDKRP